MPGPIATRKVAILVAEGFDGAGVAAHRQGASDAEGATAVLVGPRAGRRSPPTTAQASAPKFSILTTSSVLFDAVYVAGGEAGGEVGAGGRRHRVRAGRLQALQGRSRATGEGVELLEAAHIPIGGPDDPDPADDATIVAPKDRPRAGAAPSSTAMAGHRLWTREPELHLPL